MKSRRTLNNVDIKPVGNRWEIYLNGNFYAYTYDEEIAREVKEDLEKAKI